MNWLLNLAFNLLFFSDNYLIHHPKIGFRATTTNIFNDYIVNLPHHALESWVCRGPKSTDKALTARENVYALHGAAYTVAL